MSLAFLVYFQNDGVVPPVDTVTGGHFLPIYEIKAKPKRTHKVKKKAKQAPKKEQVIYRVTREQLEKLSEAISDKLPDKESVLDEITKERFKSLARIALIESEVFSNLRRVSEFILADSLIMAQIELTAKQIKLELLKKVERELENEQLFLKLIMEDII